MLSIYKQNTFLPESVSFPTASCVLDIRSGSHNPKNLIQYIKQEMHQFSVDARLKRVFHWGQLSNVIYLETVGLLSEKDCETIRNSWPKALAGERIGTNNSLIENFQYRIHALREEITRIHDVAVAIASQASGNREKGSLVQVILLTDAQDNKALVTTSLYAKALVDKIPNIQITIICQGWDEVDKLRQDVIRHLSLYERGKPFEPREAWSHINRLILIEQQPQVGASTPPDMLQTLVYLLLIAPQQDWDEWLLQDEDDIVQAQFEPVDKQNGHSATFPDYTYVVGLSLITYAGRTGRAWLNYRLVEEICNILGENTSVDKALARKEIEDLLGKWMQTVNEHFTELFSTIEAVAILNKVRRRTDPQGVFTSDRFTPSIGASTLEAFQHYRDALQSAYTPSQSGGTFTYAGSQEPIPTLGGAIEATKQVPQEIKQWESTNVHFEKSAVGRALNQTRTDLTDKAMFVDSHGILSRSSTQSEELREFSESFQSEHEQRRPNIVGGGDALREQGEKGSGNLRKLVAGWPVLVVNPAVKQLMAVVTMVLTVLWLFVALCFSLAWLDKALSSTTQILDASTAVILFWVILALLSLIVLFLFGRYLFRKEESGLRVEASFLLILLLFGVTGIIATLFAASLATDPIGKLLQSILSPLFAGISVTVLILCVLLALIESILSLSWYKDLLEKRNSAVNVLQEPHQRHLAAVRKFLMDEIALYPLKSAESHNANRDAEAFQKRITQCKLLIDQVGRDAKDWHEWNWRILTQCVATLQQQGPSAMPLRVHRRYLDYIVLRAECDKIVQELADHDDMNHFAVILVRTLRDEKLDEKRVATLYEKLFGQTTDNKSRAVTTTRPQLQEDMQALITLCVATILRLVVDPSSDGIASTFIGLRKEYQDKFIYPVQTTRTMVATLDQLIQILEGLVVERLKSSPSKQQSISPEDIQTVTMVLALWTRTLWESNDDLIELLGQDNMMVRLLDQEYNLNDLTGHIILTSRVITPGSSPYTAVLMDQRAFELAERAIAEKAVKDDWSIRREPDRNHLPIPDEASIGLLCVQRYEADPVVLS